MLLISAIENTIKHSKKDTPSPGIQILIQVDTNQLFLRTKNQIKSHQNNIIKEGIGLQNLKRSLELLYPNKFQLNYKIKNNEFIFNLNLKLS